LGSEKAESRISKYCTDEPPPSITVVNKQPTPCAIAPSKASKPKIKRMPACSKHVAPTCGVRQTLTTAPSTLLPSIGRNVRRKRGGNDRSLQNMIIFCPEGCYPTLHLHLLASSVQVHCKGRIDFRLQKVPKSHITKLCGMEETLAKIPCSAALVGNYTYPFSLCYSSGRTVPTLPRHSAAPPCTPPPVPLDCRSGLTYVEPRLCVGQL